MKSEVVAFDTGPANMLIDVLDAALAAPGPTMLLETVAASGTVHADMLDVLLDDAYYKRKPPKSTGREYFNEKYVDRVLSLAKRNSSIDQPADIIATATALTIETVARAFS